MTTKKSLNVFSVDAIKNIFHQLLVESIDVDCADMEDLLFIFWPRAGSL